MGGSEAEVEAEPSPTPSWSRTVTHLDPPRLPTGLRPGEPSNRSMLRARDAIDRHYSQPLGIPAPADIAMVSPAHFIRRLSRTLGETPHRHLQRRRIERAMALLRTTTRSVTEICFEVGRALDEQSASQVRDLLTKGALGLGFILTTDGCQRTFEQLSARGVEFTQEPVDQGYGIDCAIRDPFGNHIRITQPAGGAA